MLIENLGSDLTLKEMFPDRDPLDVANERLAELKQEQAAQEYVLLPELSSSKRTSGQEGSLQGRLSLPR